MSDNVTIMELLIYVIWCDSNWLFVTHLTPLISVTESSVRVLFLCPVVTRVLRPGTVTLFCSYFSLSNSHLTTSLTVENILTIRHIRFYVHLLNPSRPPPLRLEHFPLLFSFSFFSSSCYLSKLKELGPHS